MINNILKFMKNFTDKKNPLLQLQYVYYNSSTNELVASNSMDLIVIKYDLNLDSDVYINVNKVSSLKGKEVEIGDFKGYVNDLQFPDYKRIIPSSFRIEKEIDLKDFSTINNLYGNINYFIDCDYRLLINHNRLFSKLKYKIEDVNVCINDKELHFMV